jgi:hypothetical protein
MTKIVQKIFHLDHLDLSSVETNRYIIIYIRAGEEK